MYQNQWPDEVKERLKRGEKLDIVDVREDHEWISGHIPGARHIPIGQLVERSDELDKNKEIIFVCHAGGRSAAACEYFAEEGYKVVNLMGGMLQWTGEVEFGS